MEWDFTREDLDNVYKNRPVFTILVAYLEYNQPKCVDVRLWRGC